MSQPRPSSDNPSAPPPSAPVVDLGFVAARSKLIDVAAFLDRAQRHGLDNDFRCAAMREALAVLADGNPERARRILEKLSDPTTAPADQAIGQACGAWRTDSK